MPFPNPPSDWITRAMKTRDVALRINDPAAHEEMLKMAASYERLAEDAIALAKLDLPSSPSDAIRDACWSLPWLPNGAAKRLVQLDHSKGPPPHRAGARISGEHPARQCCALNPIRSARAVARPRRLTPPTAAA
jgi:hypothetical protein